MAKTAVTQRSWIVKVLGIDGNFDSFSGGERSAEISKHYDGGSLEANITASNPETDNITVSRAYYHERDAELHRQLRGRVGTWVTTITKSPTRPDMTIIGEPSTYPDALLIRVSEPESDSNSSDISTFELEFAVSRVV